MSTEPRQAGNAKIAFVGLQQRLLSSIAAFLRTLQVHRKGLVALIEDAEADAPVEAAKAFVTGAVDLDELPLDAEEDGAEKVIIADDDAANDAATRLGSSGAQAAELSAELAAVEEMIAVAMQAAQRADARVDWLVDWIRSNMMAGGSWEQPTADPLHGMGGYAAMVAASAPRNICGYRPHRRADRRLQRHDRNRPAGSHKARFQCRPSDGASAHPGLHGCGARGHQSADAVSRPDPRRPALEPFTARTA